MQHLQGAKVGVEVESQDDFMTVLLEVDIFLRPSLRAYRPIKSRRSHLLTLRWPRQHAGGEVFLLESAMTAACQAADRAAKEGRRPGIFLDIPALAF